MEPITVPGVYDMPHDDYLADPVAGGSLSSSGAKRLLPPSCPAKFRYWADHGQPPKAEFDFGHAAHLRVLGAGPDIHIVNADDWRTKAARQARDEAYANGLVPLLRDDYIRVEVMAEALRAHPWANALFDPERGGLPEQTLVWLDFADTGVWCRARPDWLPADNGRRLIIPDYKTTDDASPAAVRKHVYNYGYHQQATHYLDGAQALGLGDEDAAFVFVFQEKTPPYLVHVVQLDDDARRAGRARNTRARQIYAECVETGRWPGYADDEITEISLPGWADREYLED